MVSTELRDRPYLARHASRLAHSKILYGLISVACSAANAQLDEFISRLVIALIRSIDVGGESRQTSLCLGAAKRLKSYGQAFRLLASVHLQSALQQELDHVEFPQMRASAKRRQASPVAPNADLAKKVLLSNMARRIDSRHTVQLTALRTRLSRLMGRDALSANQNPFRAEIFLGAIDAAWREFSPDAAAHALVLPLLRPEIFLDPAPILAALNQSLIASGVLPDLSEADDIESSVAQFEARNKNAMIGPATLAQLRQIASPQAAPQPPQTFAHGGPHPPHPPVAGTPRASTGAINKQLQKFLSGLHRHQVDHQSVAGAYGVAPSSSVLGHIKKTAPTGTLTRTDENIVDLLAVTFNTVFADHYLPTEIKGLIGIVQIPVLQAVLADTALFLDGRHPARRLVDLLVKLGGAWDQREGRGDPLYQVILRNVKRIQHEYEHQANVFSEVVADLETVAEQIDSAVAKAFSKPAAKVVKQEKLKDSSNAAKHDIASRIGAGDVAFFVETFLKSKWLSVLTFAHNIEEDKPQAVQSALQTMDDLVWSVKPKITAEERENLIARLPSMLGMLNKWLKVVELDEAEHRRFFAELSECHASIVRAPLKMSPQRKLEMAVNIAKQAAERRLNKGDEKGVEPIVDDFSKLVEQMERGMWLDFLQTDSRSMQARLLWISPLRNVYVFSSRDRAGSFSLSADELARSLREGRATIVTQSGWSALFGE